MTFPFPSFSPTAAGGTPSVTFANVKLLLGFEGVDAATATSDESGAAHGAATFNGNAQLDTAQFKFGASSLLLDGTGDFITFPDSADWDLSDNNSDLFTVECFIRPHSASNQSIVGQGSFGSNTLSWVLWFSAAKQLSFYTSSGGNLITNTIGGTGTIMTLDTWYHVACDKDATGKIRLYVDGTMVGSATPADSTFFNSTAVISIGSTDVPGNAFNGWIDELRITKGQAAYASDAGFIAPTAAFPRS